MNRIMKRTWIMRLFVLTLLAGLVLFGYEYVTGASRWIGSPGSGYMQADSIGRGTVLDRDGEVLLTVGDSKQYSADPDTRRSTLHWLGDRQGNIVSGAVVNYSGTMSGYDLFNGIYQFSGQGGRIQLTLSARVQNAALEAMGSRKGTVAVYNYETGELLCALTTPNYDPDNVPDISAYGDAYEGVYLNRFLQSTYIPGSIFKVVTTAAALQYAPEILEETFTCYGIREYGEEKVSCEHAHGKQDLKTALAHSCNCAFSYVAERVGRKNMVRFVEDMKLTEPLEFDGITTARGNYDISQAGAVSFAWSCIGQYTDLINPARFMTFMGAIAGGGEGAVPYVVSSVEAGDDSAYEAKTRSTGRLLSKEIAQVLQDYLRNNVLTIYGAGNFPGLTVCGKSGTSQLGGGKTSNAMFAGFVTDPEYPLAFIAVVEEGGYGSAACVPILKAVLAECKAVLDGVSYWN